MKKKTFNLKMLLLVALLFAGFDGIAQKIHMIVVTQNDNRIGSPTDKENIKDFSATLEQYVGVDVNMVFIDGAVASEDKIKSTVQNLQASANDVIWYYYSGHGINFNTWPESDEQSVPLTWVHSTLKNTNARLTIASYDCCNYDEPVENPPSELSPRSFFLKFLFLQSKGNIIVSSCSSEEFSYGANGVGGVFTNSLIDALLEGKSWEDVLQKAKQNTSEIAATSRKEQVPKYAFENFQDTGETPIPPAPGRIRIRTNDTLEKIASRLEKLILDKDGTEITITAKDLQRWNPGVTDSNLHRYNNDRKLYWDLEQ
jgi:hypothetical protein